MTKLEQVAIAISGKMEDLSIYPVASSHAEAGYNIRAVARAAVEALREPDEKMKLASSRYYGANATSIGLDRT